MTVFKSLREEGDPYCCLMSLTESSERSLSAQGLQEGLSTSMLFMAF